MHKNIYILLFALLPSAAFSQTFTDGLMMPKGSFCTGAMYSHDKWTDYWEGTLKRHNDNIGTITTQSVTWIGTYGITDKINVLVTFPYVWTKASQGTLRGMEGIQDITIGGKYNFFARRTEASTLKFFGSLSFAMPLTDYTPDFLPLSIGTATKRLNWRATAFYRIKQGWFGNVSAGYTWRSNVTLDRPAHMYDGHNINNTEAFVPNVVDLFASLGYIKGPIQAEANFMQMTSVDGDDIARQAMPEVGNRMNATKVGATIMYYVPKPKGLALRLAGSYTLVGRNAGVSTTLMAGILYTIRFKSTTEQVNTSEQVIN